ncbi:MAG: hypothetical protein HY735_29790 [Verrucomicrobia bacterium]|nr:hypothetical protein [Verrucomicrobiota bacterium]
MTTLPKALLTISVVAFAVSLTGPGAEFAGGIIKPIGAICFILFYIANLLAREFEGYDQDQRAKSGLFGKILSSGPGSNSKNESAAKGGPPASFAGAGTR